MRSDPAASILPECQDCEDGRCTMNCGAASVPVTGPAFAAARGQLGLTQPQIAALFGRKLRQVQYWESRGPDDLAARYMAALLSGYRPDDWPAPAC